MDENQRQMKEVIQTQDQKFDAMFEEHQKAQAEELAKMQKKIDKIRDVASSRSSSGVGLGVAHRSQSAGATTHADSVTSC